MNDAFGVRRIEPIGHLRSQLKDGLHFHRTATDAMFQRNAIQILHDDEGLSPFLANFVNRTDVRVI